MVLFDVEQAVVGNGHTVGIAAHVVDNLLRSGKGRFGVDDPFGLLEGSDIGTKLVGVSQFFNRAEKLELAGVEGRLQILEEQAAKQTG